jgi:predicted alpha/beta superfamily hydrolase
MSPTFTLTSPQTGTKYHLYVHGAAEPLGRELRRPMVAFLDGDDQFTAAIAAYDGLRAQGRVDPLWLVGVGYAASYSKPANRRGRDYTPVPHSDEPSSGGGDAFLSFLTETLWPELQRRLPVQAEKRGLAGHSLGSLLVLHALFQPQPFFTRYLASAPSIWWADRAVLRQVAALRDRQARLPGRLFLSVGERDSASMTGDLTLLEQQLAAQPFAELEVTTRRIPDRDHYNVLPDAFGAGLQALFGEPLRP